MNTIVRFEGRTTSGYEPYADGCDMPLGRTDLAQEDRPKH